MTDTRACSRCGRRFSPPPTQRKGGRPRTRCDACRSNQARNDGAEWRQLRARVLAEEPICRVPGCSRPSTEVDHIVPLVRRPDLGLERTNLQALCKPHNASKGARLGVSRPARDARLCQCPDPFHGAGCTSAVLQGETWCAACRVMCDYEDDPPDEAESPEPAAQEPAADPARRVVGYAPPRSSSSLFDGHPRIPGVGGPTLIGGGW